jgi:Flp pilus assembly protein TadG
MKNQRGQAMVEMAIFLPLIVLLCLGVVEVSYALLDQHVVTKLTREGSNLISRDATLGDAAVAMSKMATRPIDFTQNSAVIFSVIKRVPTTGAPNYNKDILYARYSFGAISATSQLATRGSGVFGSAPDYEAKNSDTDTNLQITNLPPGLMTTAGSMLYVTEVYTNHTLITPLDRFGITLPTTLSSIAFF